MPTEVPTMTCEVTGAVAKTRLTRGGKPMLPRGWKRDTDGKVWSAAAWKERYVSRSLTLRVFWPDGADKDECWRILRNAWSQSTAASNYILQELRRQDFTRTPEMTKCPPAKFDASAVYSAVRRLWPTLPGGTVTALIQDVRLYYQARRFAALWLCREVLTGFRYPVPFPVRAKDWRPAYDSEGRVVISALLPGGRLTLQPSMERGFVRQRKMLEGIADGTVRATQLELLQRRRDGKTWIMATIAYSLEREQRGIVKDSLHVVTGGSWLLRAQLPSGRLWTMHADHLRRIAVAHRQEVQSHSDDYKFERRLPRSHGRDLRNTMDRAAALYRDRCRTRLHHLTRMVVELAKRQRVEGISYDDRERAFLGDGPYYLLKLLLQEKCEAAGLAWTEIAESTEEEPAQT